MYADLSDAFGTRLESRIFSMLEHHEARMRLSALPNGGCEFAWEADILPTNFEVFLKDSMTGALAQLIEVVARAEGS